MDKLRKKVFWVIFLILTIFTTSVFAVYNVQQYNGERLEIVRNFTQIERVGKRVDFPDGNEPPQMPDEPEQRDFKNIRYMDNTVYTVLLNDDNSVSEIVNHSSDDKTDEEIEEIANDILAENRESKIGNLYTCKYSYSISNSTLVIIDNENTNSVLLKTLLISFALLIALELLILLISLKITKWIIKPVEESFEKQKQFIADASHELKTPLAVIMASSEALESNPSETKWLENIKSESDRMNKLISDLLELAKSESVDDRSEFKTGNISKTVEKSVLTFEGIMFEKGITLDYSIDENIEIEMNEYKIQQLVSILLDNAIKHSDKNGKINVNLKKDRDIVLIVSNTGEGIPKGDEEKIFERFYRADESRNRNENRYGLGLAIAKNIALSHNAEISAASDNGTTTFKVVFK
ncbi:MAG: HAMP domain-containing histidine kinase [Ruminococcaceae bacterium]|nr:HAMP domain-containing histidine kinase [Oscillospiraceae bacterium]